MSRKLMTFLTLLLSSTVWAEGAAPARAGGAGGLMSMAPLALIFVVFYFLLIRPQQKQAKEHQKMLDGVKRGDRIITSGGLFGQVQSVRGKVLDVKLDGDGVKVAIAKSGVANIVFADAPAEAEVVGTTKS